MQSVMCRCCITVKEIHLGKIIFLSKSELSLNFEQIVEQFQLYSYT